MEFCGLKVSHHWCDFKLDSLALFLNDYVMTEYSLLNRIYDFRLYLFYSYFVLLYFVISLFGKGNEADFMNSVKLIIKLQLSKE